MKKRYYQYLKQVIPTLIIMILAAMGFGLYHGASLSYAHNPARLEFDREGPYVFYKNDSTLLVNYIKGSKEDGFYLQQKEFPANGPIPVNCYFALDSTQFNFNILPDFETPPSEYKDQNKILAISDIESGFKTFRDFLINNKVIDKGLQWSFGKNHLVLTGDFVDRGFSTTQVLWFIYKLEQDAKKQGGKVHFIIGNHELKNMYGDYQAASLKYTFIASILGKTQANLYDGKSVLGKWLASKNTIESINGILFAHGGLHPKVADIDMSLREINDYLRTTYYTAPYPKPDKDQRELLTSSDSGICWYRGYFKEDLTQEEVNRSLDKFNAKAIVVGHTLQSRVKRYFKGRVIGIDVKHSKDYHKNWPPKDSEGLMISNNGYYRVLDDGQQLKLE